MVLRKNVEKLKDYFGIVWKNLASRKTRSYLTLVGIFIGIAAVIGLIGLGEGLKTAISGQFGLLGTDIVTVQAAGLGNRGPPGSYVITPLSDDLAHKIEGVSGVDAAINRYVKTTTLEFNDRQTIGYVGTYPNGPNRKILETSSNVKAERGRLLRDGDGRKVVVGNSYYSQDTMFGKPVDVGSKMLINGVQFEVIGVLEKKGSFITDITIGINEDVYKDTFGDDGTVNAIAVKVKDVDETDEVVADIEKLMRKERDVDVGDEDFTVQSAKKSIEDLNSALSAVQIFVYIIAGISIVVGAIGITNTMYTSVLERTKEIGIMKSIGARNSMIFSIFFLESGFFGMIGGALGIIGGLIFAFGMSFIGRVALGSDLIQATVSPWLIIFTLLGSFVIGIVAGFIPAYQASRMPPVEALRYEK